jgi:mannose-6-phosphate isomerase-like protein (cupin superfamily)
MIYVMRVESVNGISCEKSPNARKEEKMEIVDINEKAKYGAQFAPIILRTTPKYKTPLICMNPGQEIPPHPSATGIFYIVSGSAVMTINDVEQTVKAGQMIFVDAGETLGIRAVEKLTAFAVHITP